MANYSFLAIGIDRYQFIQPLSYAQADAQALWQFMLGEAQVPSQQSLLLTDTSAWVAEQSTVPTKDNILTWLQSGVSARSIPWLWFFFSGYGVSWEGEDYLMPIDGNPDDIPGTAIAARSLLELLQQQGASNVLVLLDINRSPGILAGQSVGAQTVELAREMGISAVLSSQLQETSHESAALGHGMFAASLLEALRYYQHDLTLDSLNRYLSDRLPELSEHHWRPAQNPLFVIPDPQLSQQAILPGEPWLLAWEAPATANASAVGAERVPIQSNGKATSAQIATSAPIKRQNPPPLAPPANAAKLTNGSSPQPANGANNEPDEPSAFQNWQKWVPVGGGIFLLAVLTTVVFGLLPDNQPQLSDSKGSEDANSSSTETSEGSTLPQPDGTSEDPNASPAETSEGSTLPQPDGTAGENSEPTSVATNASDLASEPAVNSSTSSGAATLVKARSYLRTHQASDLSQAIAAARKVPSNTPYYQEAQRCIGSWSMTILDIARSRANQGNFTSAIAAASLIAPQEAQIHKLASQKIQQWQRQAQQQQHNQKIIKGAKEVIRYTQASSYNHAITLLKQIPIGQPGYSEAKKLIAIWSRQIYLISNSRAASGKFQLALDTAKLVPQGTPSYEAAKSAISRWQQGKR